MVEETGLFPHLLFRASTPMGYEDVKKITKNVHNVLCKLIKPKTTMNIVKLVFFIICAFQNVNLLV